MLTEEALLLIAILVGCALLVLGTLEMVWPTRSRHPVRRHVAAGDPWRRARSRATRARPLASPVTTTAFPAPLGVAEGTRFGPESIEEPAIPAVADMPLVAFDAPPAAVSVGAPPLGETPPSPASPPLRLVPPTTTPADMWRQRSRRAQRLRPVPRPESRPEPLEKLPSSGAAPLVEPRESLAGERPAVERFAALLAAKRFAEVVTIGEEELEARKSVTASAPSPAAAQETAGLWGVVGLAKQGLDDFEGARFAFEEAIALAPGTDRPTWEHHLAALALTVGRQSLGDSDAEPSRPGRVDSIRSAIDWLERGLAVAPDDAALREALVAARDALWLTNEAAVKALVQRKDFVEARRVIDEVMTDPDCPPGQRRAFRALRGGALGGEVGQATAEAVRLMRGGREAEAVAALARAERVMTQIAADGLPAKRRQELERRVWWGYMKLGVNRVAAGAHEAAMSPLFRALSFTDVGSERQEKTRATLVRALEEIVRARSVDIGALIDVGDTGVAAVQGDKLWSLLRGAVDEGLPQDYLADAFAKVSALFHRMGDQRPREA